MVGLEVHHWMRLLHRQSHRSWWRLGLLNPSSPYELGYFRLERVKCAAAGLPLTALLRIFRFGHRLD